MANVGRIQNNLEILRDIKEPNKLGTTRLSYTVEYQQAVAYLKQEMIAAGLVVREDAIGTLYGLREGTATDAQTIISGSHLDTVQSSGYFDGQAGITCALEVARMLEEQDVQLKNNYEVIVTVMEEGSRFDALFGTEFITGKLCDADTDVHFDAEGISLREALKAYGLAGEVKNTSREHDKIKAFIEVHVEQGRLLDDARIPLGIVQNINGCRWYEVEIIGVGTHGSTPMLKRQDASLAAARFITELEDKIMHTHAEALTLTVGTFAVSPGSKNAVPSKVVFSIDSRTSVKENYVVLDGYLEELTSAIHARYGVEVRVRLIPSTDPVAMDGELNAVVAKSIEKLGYDATTLNSPGSHDAMVLAEIWPTTMLFVPSRNGISHDPAEWTDYENLEKASNVLFETVLALDKK